MSSITNSEKTVVTAPAKVGKALTIRGKAEKLAASYKAAREPSLSAEEREVDQVMTALVVGKAPKAQSADAIAARVAKALSKAQTEATIAGIAFTDVDKKVTEHAAELKGKVAHATKEMRFSLTGLGYEVVKESDDDESARS